MPKRQIVLMRSGAANETPRPLGSRQEVRDALSRFNTGVDGSPPKPTAGTELLHGPGMLVELPTTTDAVVQAMVTMTDDDIAWPVLMRICQQLKWKMVDLESGRSFG